MTDAVAAGGGQLLVWTDPSWEGFGDTTLSLELRAAPEGPIRRITPFVGGVHPVGGLADGQAAAVQIRVVGPSGPGAWSAPAAATPTAEGFDRVAVWADGFASGPLDATVTHIAARPMTDAAALAAGAAAINAPLRLPDGTEVEYVGGPDSLFVRWFAHEDRRNAPDSRNPAPRPVPEIRWRHVEPAGRHADLAPLETREVPFALRMAGDGAERAGRIVVLGAAGAQGQMAMSATGLDPDGDPVFFRFDRLALTGLHPDGRPWVVGPVGLLRNGGPPVAVAPGAVVARDGALLSVVERPGLVPRPVPTLTPDFDPAYVRPAGPQADWPGWPEGGREATGLTVRAQFESLHLALDSDSPEPAAVRFRPEGAIGWFPAQPLVFDPRQPDAGGDGRPDMRPVVPGAHRGAILHLAPGTAHTIEVRQGRRVWQATASTRSYKPARQSRERLGTVDGDLLIDRGGVPGAYREIHSGLVRGGRVRVAASHVILRDIDVLGAPLHGIELAPGVRDVRIVRGRIAGWGESDRGRRPTNLGWGGHFDSAIAGGEPRDPRRPEAGRDPVRDSRDDIAVLGTRIGSPRFPANTWEEWNPAIGRVEDQRPLTNTHPWGPYAISVRQGSYRGGWTVSDVSIAAERLRSFNDAMGGDANQTRGVGGFGPDFVFAYSYVTGVADDIVEHEGSGQTGVILGNFFDAVPLRDFTLSPRSHLGLSIPYWGPTYILRNAFHRRVPEGFRGVAGHQRVFKIQRRMEGGTDTGRIVLWHNTVFGGPMIEAMTGSGGPLGHVTGRNNLFHTRAAEGDPARGDGMDWSQGAVVLTREQTRGAFAGTDHAPRGRGPWLTGAAPLANVNDAGPWAWGGPPAFGAAVPRP